MKNLTYSLLFLIGFLMACNEEVNTTEMNDNTDSLAIPVNPEVNSSEPIHAVGGKIEEDPNDINHEISAHGGAMTPEEIMKLFYPHEAEVDGTGKEVISITQEALEGDQVKVILVDDNMEDDAQKTTKIEMTLSPIGDAWKVLKIEKQWKCYEGRGHTDWGIQSCN
jgi:hypothetical protein